MDSAAREEIANWLMVKLSQRIIDSFGVVESLFTIAAEQKILGLELVDESRLKLRIGADELMLEVDRARGKLRMLLSKVGGYYLDQNPDPDFLALYGFDGLYRHKDSVLQITSLNGEKMTPSLKLRVAEDGMAR